MCFLNWELTVFSKYVYVTILSVKNQTKHVELIRESNDDKRRNKNNMAVIATQSTDFF